MSEHDTIHPPHDIDAERALLGSLLIDRDAIIHIAPLMQASDFYDSRHAKLFTVIVALYNERKPADLVLLYNELLRVDALNAAGGLEYVSGLLQAEMTPVHANYYATIVVEMSIRRQHIGLGGEVAKLAYDTSSPINDMLAAVGKLSGQSIALPQDPYIDSFEAVDALMRQASSTHPPRICTTGYVDLDARMRGFLDGWLVVVGARTGKGKTSFATGLLYEHCIRRERPAALISLEMPPETIMQRLMALASQSDTSDLLFEHERSYEREEALARAAGMLSNGKLTMVRSASSEWATIAAQARDLVAKRGIELLVVDYVGLIHDSASKSGSRVQELSGITRGLKLLAMNLNIPIVGLQQLNRKVDERGEDAKARLSDLRESGSFEQDADVVLFVTHDEPKPGEELCDAEFHVAKNRHGRTGHVQMYWRPQTAQFVDAYLGEADR